MKFSVFNTPPEHKPKTSKYVKSVTSSVRSMRTAISSVASFNLSHVAKETKRKVKWDSILRGAGTNGVQWKWQENTRHFAIYTKQPKNSSTCYSVLSVGTVKASVHEVASLLVSNTQADYTRKMTALHTKEFKQGTYVVDVPYDMIENDESNVHLSVRSATFAHPRWVKRDDQWNFLESTEYDADSQRFVKLMTTLTSSDVEDSPLEGKFKATESKQFRDMIAGYCIQPEEGETPNCPPTVRVNFYGELESAGPSHTFKRLMNKEASTKTMKDRLFTMAKDCDRLTKLVNRRRLGVQVLVDRRRVFLPREVICHTCNRKPLAPKLCRLCGQGVCGDCSDKYQRETHHLGGSGPRVRVDKVRVCDPCMKRVEMADYSNMRDAALVRTGILPDVPREDGVYCTDAANDLKNLLQDAWLEAESPQRRAAVMNVIRTILGDKKTKELRRSDKRSDRLTTLNSERDYLRALNNLEVETTPYNEVETADRHGRAFALRTAQIPTAKPLPYPITKNEPQRIKEITKTGVLDDPCDELKIICDIAAQEMNTFGVAVTMITADAQVIVATNEPTLENVRMNREESFCQHTIMSDKPLIIPNPESDVRFNRMAPVTDMGIRYYAGFPITAGDDNTVIGALCCVDQKKHDMTETQFNAMQKLAQTASKVVKMHSERRRSSGTLPPKKL